MAGGDSRRGQIEDARIVAIGEGIYQRTGRVVKQESVTRVRQAIADAPIGQFADEASETRVVCHEVGDACRDHGKATRRNDDRGKRVAR